MVKPLNKRVWLGAVRLGRFRFGSVGFGLLWYGKILLCEGQKFIIFSFYFIGACVIIFITNIIADIPIETKNTATPAHVIENPVL
jgi:hypothetical protein